MREAAAWLLVTAAVGATLLQARRGVGSQTSCLWRIAMLTAVCLLRWPQLLAPQEFSPDESQSLAGAITLRHDPRFWISVDGATAGPVHYFAQVPCTFTTGDHAYLGARTFALIAVMGIIFGAGAVVRAGTSGLVEQLVILPAALAFGLTRTPDFQHLATEIIPVLLVTLVVAWHWTSDLTLPTSGVRAALSGLALGLAPLAKLQITPLALAAGILIAFHAMRCGRRASVVALGIGFLVPYALAATYLTSTHAWDDAVTAYVFGNVAYVSGTEFGLLPVLREIIVTCWLDGYVAAFALLGLFVVVASMVLRPVSAPSRPEIEGKAWAWLLLGFVCLAIPRRPYAHYLYLLLPPALIVIGWRLGRLLDWATGRNLRYPCAALLLFILVSPLIVVRTVNPNSYGWLTGLFARYHRENVALAAAMAPYQREGDTLAIWGIRSGLYLTARLPQAIPQAHAQAQLTTGPWQSHFLRVYATRFITAPPAFFVDAVGSGNFLYEDRREDHTAFPPLREAVSQHYVLITEISGTRIYVRRDRVPRPTVLPGALEH